MGNNPSKPAGGPQSPVTSHSSNSSTSHSRKDSRAQGTHPARGGSISHPKSPSPSHIHKHSQSTTSSPSHQRYSQDDRMGNEQSKQKWKDKAYEAKTKEKESSNPVRVPQNRDQKRQKGPDSQFEPSGPPRDPNYIPHSNLNFPPRLPLPIEEELHTPGSPILTPGGISSELHDDDMEVELPRQLSALSSTTVDEDEYDDELPQYPEASQRTVPTTVWWKKPGDKVYVTGTFTSWSRKYRMNRDPQTNYLSTVLQLPPGTHHVKFIVDGDMQLSNELPTAVDYTNILVNYIEVSADDLPRESGKDQVPEGVHPPQIIPGTETKDHAPDSVGKIQPGDPEKPAEPVFFGDQVPQYLEDLDRVEQSRKYQRAAKGIADFPTPPGLPMFLGKSILNGSTPMKDDNSVLNMPNHTVLNHLATSSIKNQVLATSVTTRYKRKYVTTMMYKPTVETEE
ncbi:MAG: hypothetical protein HETSPECPRED_000413 [Heterodermia speciosa]|uniref:Association with the SNF1 complex (ASC) domain-containing protein n=1 Tax=Heterodermia speciosa TaxID=116794 RepID=A0A8H3EU08_9LECA|nr:MAG: hypothetical protein HETSPECPRED_000413 [Heterodermia speciosa]